MADTEWEAFAAAALILLFGWMMTPPVSVPDEVRYDEVEIRFLSGSDVGIKPSGRPASGVYEFRSDGKDIIWIAAGNPRAEIVRTCNHEVSHYVLLQKEGVELEEHHERINALGYTGYGALLHPKCFQVVWEILV